MIRLLIVAFLVTTQAAQAQTAGQKRLAPEEPYQALTLTPEQVHQVQTDLRRFLRDPDSARFGAFAAAHRVSKPHTITVCGTVNAKNSYGGYTGSQPFVGMLRVNDGKMAFLPLDFGSSPLKIGVIMDYCLMRAATVPPL